MTTTPPARPTGAGEILLSVEDMSLSFGGIKAIREVSFDIRKGEIRAIIGPNGAGKSSMLNVINGVYHPQIGTVTFKGETRHHVDPHHAASQGIARTFQNIALFRGKSAPELHALLQAVRQPPDRSLADVLDLEEVDHLLHLEAVLHLLALRRSHP